MNEHKSLAEALAAFQAELPRVAKDAKAVVKSDKGSYTYEYAGLDEVSAVVLPKLAAHGLSFSSKPTVVEGKFVLEYVLRHALGDEDRGVYPLPTSGRPQEVGSAITYARRYVLLSMSGVFPGGEDDDGKAAQETRVEAGPYWDSAEQQMLVDGWSADIGNAATPEAIAEIGLAVAAAKRNGALSPASYDHLAKRGAARKAELTAVPA